MKYFLYIFIILVFNGCIYKSGHTLFIEEMSDRYMIWNNNYNDRTQYDYRISNDRLVSVSVDHNKNKVYHFKGNNPKGCKTACMYYIVVDKEGIITGWGFDQCDKEKCCRILG